MVVAPNSGTRGVNTAENIKFGGRNRNAGTSMFIRVIFDGGSLQNDVRGSCKMHSPAVVSTYRVTRELPAPIQDELPTVEDLQEVVNKLRAPLTIEPAKSLDQMLYKRASAGRGFYKTTEREVWPDRATHGRGDSATCRCP